MDLIPYEPAVCEIHHTGMRAEIVPIHYGTPISMFRDKDSKRLLAPGEIDPERANGAGATRSLPPGGREFLFRSENDRVGI